VSAQRLSWRPGPRLRRLATVSLIGVAAALVTGEARLLLLAAPAIAALAVSGRRGRPAEVDVTAEVSAGRCFEGEDVTLAVTVTAGQPCDEIALEAELPGTAELADGNARQLAAHAAAADGRWAIRPQVWGRRALGQVRLSLASGGIWRSEVRLTTGELEVYPRGPAVRPSLVPTELHQRIGEHRAPQAGSGIEFAAIRDYQPGDRLRDINWAVSSRRGRLFVNQRAPQHAADLVLMIDGFSEIGPDGDSTIDAAVRGAAAVADAYLRAGDRVGVVVLGGLLRWLSPGTGGTQLYRIAELLFDVRNDSVVRPDLGRIPRVALPPGALVLVFSPLLDERATGAVTDLRRRGFWPVVVDVLRRDPPVTARSDVSALAVRVWRLDREVLRASLAEIGVPVVSWPADPELDATLAPLRGQLAPAGPR
jgi:uncharacterized protein (DUF58 family)